MPSKGAIEREQLFNSLNARLLAIRPESGDTILCPICVRPFGREALEGNDPILTLAHIIPDALGGNRCTLACKDCNNGNGEELEAFLVRRFRDEDFLTGVGTKNCRLRGDFGSIGVEVQAGQPDGSWALLIIDKQTNPAHRQNLDEALAENTQAAAGLNLTFEHNPHQVIAAIYQSAYLQLFDMFGYQVVLDPRFEPLRQQIRNPESEILPRTFTIPPDDWVEKSFENMPYVILFAKEPVSSIRVCLRFRPDGGLPRVLCITLPGMDSESWPEDVNGKVRGEIFRIRGDRSQLPEPHLQGLWDIAKQKP